MQRKGKLLTCNRCRKSVFLEFEGMEPQEWSQPREKYAAAPDGWAAATSLGASIDLCPDCTEKWTTLQKRFMVAGELPEEKTESGLLEED